MSDATGHDAHDVLSVCGNGAAEIGEQCDDGNDDDTDVCANDCTLNGQDTHDVTIKWWFNRDDTLGFEGDACTDLGVQRVDVEIELFAQPSVRYASSEDCAFRQVRFLGVPVGAYRVRVRLLDSEGMQKTTADIVREAVIAPPVSLFEVEVRPDDWRDSYTGTFFFRLRWGDAGADCLDALPPVAQHVLLLEQADVAVAQQTDAGDPLDGSTAGPCRSLNELLPQVAEELPFGASRFTVVGLDDGGVEAYRAVFDTFIGAGVSNPELVFDVVATPVE